MVLIIIVWSQICINWFEEYAGAQNIKVANKAFQIAT